MPRAVLAALSFVLLAGCTTPYDKEGGDGDDGDAPQCTPGVDGCPCPEDSRAAGEVCEPVDSVLFDIQVSGSGEYEVGVPYPHGSWCLTGEDWLDGMQETKNLDDRSVGEVDRGKVLRLMGRDDSKFVSRIELGNRTECQTLRDDPWSIDPDPADGTLEVHADGAVAFTIYLRTVRGTCEGEAEDAPGMQAVRVQKFEGEASGGWGTLAETFDQPTC